jgi:hypothetical protein
VIIKEASPYRERIRAGFLDSLDGLLTGSGKHPLQALSEFELGYHHIIGIINDLPSFRFML